MICDDCQKQDGCQYLPDINNKQELICGNFSPRTIPRAGELSRFPAVRRDLAVLVAEPVEWAALSATIRESAGALLRDVVLFDRYVGQGVEPGFKSLAMGLILQDVSRTLTDSDVDAVVADVVAALAAQHGAVIRG